MMLVFGNGLVCQRYQPGIADMMLCAALGIVFELRNSGFDGWSRVRIGFFEKSLSKVFASGGIGIWRIADVAGSRSALKIVVALVAGYGIAMSLPLFVVGAFVGLHIVLGGVLHLLVGLSALFALYFLVKWQAPTSNRGD